MLARLQQFVTLSLLAAATGWLALWWGSAPVVAWSGFVLIVLGYSVFLALEFIALHSLNQNDPAGSATWTQLLAAWWGETCAAPQVFCWRQPFRSQALADALPNNGKRGVVFIHGFVCNRGLWTPWLHRLRSSERAFVAVNLEPVFGSIDEYVPIIEAAVQRVTAATGLAPVLVCHSMGGLAARAWLRAGADAARVQHIVTIGSPHHGTWLGQFSQARNGAQMRLDSAWLRQLERDEPLGLYARFTCWYSNCDNIVFPASTAMLAGADNRIVPGTAHVSLTFSALVMSATLDLILAGP
ncbi:MAG: alpha/beta fold hydrolase [Betaproteobacteria bacterium]